MRKAAIPANEPQRLAKLREYEILDTIPEKDFDDLTALAASICEAPIALVTLIDEKRQWFKSKIGIEGTETDRDLAFCSHTILQDDVFLVGDATKDERFFDHPGVVAEDGVRFYAGAPLITPEGLRLGSLCVVDKVERRLRPDQVDDLQRLARQVVSQMELRKQVRDLEVARRELHESHEAVLRANGAKLQFLANMSHEIRTPMNGIIGLTEVMLASDSSESKSEKLRIINTSGKTLLRLINDVLDYSKLESHKLVLENEPFELKVVLEDVIGLFVSQAQAKKLKLNFAIDSRVPRWLLGDSSRLSQILTNLISNAVKFTEVGTIDVKVEIASQADLASGARQKIRVSVIDTGIGISTEAQSRLFESFVQADASTTRRFGGSGLGLAISKSIVTMMNGEFALESTPGQGSNFAFTFEADTSKPPLKVVGETQVTPEMQKLRILLAEDNIVNQTVGMSMLRKLGYSPVVVSNGVEVLEKLKHEDFDIILMDRHMPLMDGVQATEELVRRLSPDKLPVIIAVTASALKEDEEACRAAGMRDFITKPVTLAQLEKSLAMWSTQILNSRKAP